MQPRLGIGIGPDVMRPQVGHPFLVGHLDNFLGPGPVAKGNGLLRRPRRQQRRQSRLPRRFQQVRPLMFIGRVKQKLPVNNPKVLARFVDAALAQQQDLLPLSQGIHGNGPLFQRQLAAFRQHKQSFSCSRN